MASKRTTILMAVLLLLILGYVSQSYWKPHFSGPNSPNHQPPLPGKNTISKLAVGQDAKGRWMADFDYFYTGAPQAAWVTVTLLSSGDSLPEASLIANTIHRIERGSHHVSTEIQRPPTIQQSFTTTQVVVQLRGVGVERSQTFPSPTTQAKSHDNVLASQKIEHVIGWPDFYTWFQDRQFADKTTEQLLHEAISQIDSGDEDSIKQAKHTLERLISKSPNFDAGYVELARVAMKTNWGPEGLHQAEALIKSALQIRPDSVNAKILLGYVYAHQKRYDSAKGLFEEAATTDTKNLWLWANWGEVLVMQGKVDQGITKYRETISRPHSNDTYDRARLDAYRKLITLLDKRNSIDELESLYKQRAQEYGSGNCYFSSYARFILQRRGDTAQAISLARKAVDGHCSDPEAREVLGLAHYAAWAAAPSAQRAELLNQAHVFLPAGPRPLYLLATSEKTIAAVKKLMESGESIDQYDNNKFNALAYAVQSGNHEVASRLIRLGARPDAMIGYDQMPIALLPVIDGDLNGIRLMRKSGVDYSKLQFQGKSILDHVRPSGDRKLLDALGGDAKSI